MTFYGYKDYTLEDPPRVFYVGIERDVPGRLTKIVRHLALTYGVAHAVIYSIIRGLTWGHVQVEHRNVTI